MKYYAAVCWLRLWVFDRFKGKKDHTSPGSVVHGSNSGKRLCYDLSHR
jgi:hypothetical protein